MARYLITVANGRIGNSVVKELQRKLHTQEGSLIIAASRRLPAVKEPNVMYESLDFHDEQTWHSALAHKPTGLFLILPPGVPKTALTSFLDAALKSGVTYVVYSSIVGTDENSWVPHAAVERHIKNKFQHWAVIRPGYFAQNLTGMFLDDIRDNSALYAPAGDGQVAWVDTRDVGEAAATVLLDPESYAGRECNLTGSETTTFAEAAKVISEATGKAIRYIDSWVLAFGWHLWRQRGLPLLPAVIVTFEHVDLKRGGAAPVYPDLEELLGRRPRTLQEFVADHSSNFLADRDSVDPSDQ